MLTNVGFLMLVDLIIIGIVAISCHISDVCKPVIYMLYPAFTTGIQL